MEEISLSTIRSVVGALASGICIADIRDSVEQALRSLLEPCIAQLEQPELKNAKSAAHILCAAASAAGITRSYLNVTLSNLSKIQAVHALYTALLLCLHAFFVPLIHQYA